MGTYNYLDLTPFGRLEGWDGMPDLHGAGLFCNNTTTATALHRPNRMAAAPLWQQQRLTTSGVRQNEYGN